MYNEVLYNDELLPVDWAAKIAGAVFILVPRSKCSWRGGPVGVFIGGKEREEGGEGS